MNFPGERPAIYAAGHIDVGHQRFYRTTLQALAPHRIASFFDFKPGFYKHLNGKSAWSFWK